MLIEFTVAGFRSFGSPCTLSCEASSERQHGERLTRRPHRNLRILPTAVLFGANGSGKSNLIQALQVLRRLVLKEPAADEPLPVVPFRLTGEGEDSPSQLSATFLVDEDVFRYRIVLTEERILEEELCQIRAASEKTIFSRSAPSKNVVRWEIGIADRLSKDDARFLDYKQRDTLPNQPFLQQMRNKGIREFDGAIRWFRDCLEVVEPHTFIRPYETFGPDDRLESFATSMLAHADTGIVATRFEPVALETLSLDRKLETNLRKDTTQPGHAVFLKHSDGRRIRFCQRDGKMKADRLVTYHANGSGKQVQFEIQDESHGTRRLIDLLPLFFSLVAKESEKVFVCDELDGNLHPLIVQALLKEFLDQGGPDRRAQLLFASHDATLFDQKLLRRDELWMVTKRRSGESWLESLSDYGDVRKDTDIRKAYLLGRYSGVPDLQDLCVPVEEDPCGKWLIAANASALALPCPIPASSCGSCSTS